MDYLLDQIPYIDRLSPEWRKTVSDRAVQLFRAADWACGTRDLWDMWKDHWSFLLGEVVFLILSFLTFIHAYKKGGRYMYLWIGIILHGLNTEAVSYLLPDVDNFWHAQSMLMLFGRRLPIYVLMGVYSVFIYTASVGAKRLHLPWWAEGPAAGLLVVLLDLPYDVMGVKLLWWSWHDTDPNVEERMYHVPWTSFYFHAAFACSFTFLLSGARRVLLPREYDWRLFPRELLCVLIAALGTFWVGALQFIPIYHFCHDYLRAPTECCVMLFLFLYAYIVWVADRRPKASARPKKWRLWFDELALVVSLYYLFFMALVFFADDPASVQSTGLHEPIGPCEPNTKVQTVSGMVLSKKTFLCPTRYDEPYFDFHCLQDRKPPKVAHGEPVEWYTICGTPYGNHAEYIFLVWALCLFGALVYFQVLGNSGETPVDPVKATSPRKRKRD